MPTTPLCISAPETPTIRSLTARGLPKLPQVAEEHAVGLGECSHVDRSLSAVCLARRSLFGALVGLGLQAVPQECRVSCACMYVIQAPTAAVKCCFV